MAKNRLTRILSRVVDIKPGEERIALLLFSYFFLITAPFMIIKSVRDAAYLDELGPDKLPYAYATAFLVGLVVSFHSKMQAKLSRYRLITFSLLFFILTSFLFFLLLPKGWVWVPVVYWMWANVFVVVTITQFWMVVNDIFNPREAKRLIGFFGSGGILGGIAGGMLAAFFARQNETHELLIFILALLVICVFAERAIFIWQKKATGLAFEGAQKPPSKRKDIEQAGFKVCFDTVRKDGYLKLLAAVVILTGIVATFIDWQSKNIIAEKITSNRASFFGKFNAGLLVFSFLFQILMTSNLVKRFGIRLPLLIYPAILILCSLGIAAWPFLFFAITIKGSDKSLSYSVNQSARELLYIPVSPEKKYKAKTFIDMFLNRFSKTGGAMILLVIFYLTNPKDPDIKVVSVVSVCFLLAWIILNLKVSKEYVGTVKEKLGREWERGDRIVDRAMDVETAKLVFDALESKNRSSDLYAMHLYDLLKKDKLTPEIRKLVGYESDEIRVASLGVLMEAEESPWTVHSDEELPPAVLEKEIREIMELESYQHLMKGFADKVIREKGRDAETAKMELAKAISLMDPRSPLAASLDDLIKDESPAVSRYAMEAAAKFKAREYVPLLIRKLADPSTREDARAALEKYGSKIIGMLGDYLEDPAEPLVVREAVSSVLAGIGTPDVAEFILQALAGGQEEQQSDLIDALDKIRSRTPNLPVSAEAVRMLIVKEVVHYTHEKKPSAVINIFKLLGLVYSHEDIFRAYQNIQVRTKDSVAYALELLDYTIEKEMRDLIFPVLEDFTAANKTV
jgi:AAA family ATP:ADP antiporter